MSNIPPYTRHDAQLEPTKLGVGVTPVATQAHVADPTGGATTDAEARAAIVSILNVLEAFGLTAAS